MDAELWGLPVWVLGLVALVPATAFAVFPPRGPRFATAPTWARLVLRWGHSLTWVLLALAAAVRVAAGTAGTATAQVLALAALAVYLLFIATLLTRSRRAEPDRPRPDARPRE